MNIKRPILFTIIALFLLTGLSYGQSNLPKPHGYINDFTGQVDALSIDTLKRKVISLKQDKNVELGVAVVETLEGYKPYEYATALAREWGVGAKNGEQRGLLILVAIKDGKSFLTASDHITWLFTDGECGRLTRLAHDNFKNRQWGDGLLLITAGIEEKVKELDKKEANPPPKPELSSDDDHALLVVGLFTLMLLGFIWFLYFLIFGKKKREVERKSFVSTFDTTDTTPFSWQTQDESEHKVEPKSGLNGVVQKERFRRQRTIKTPTTSRKEFGGIEVDGVLYGSGGMITPPKSQPKPTTPVEPTKPKTEEKKKKEDSYSYNPVPFDYSPPSYSSNHSSPSTSNDSSSSSNDTGSYGGGTDYSGGGGGDSFS
jgi:uncharacterized protein